MSQEQIVAAFNKALEMTKQAAQSLPAEYSSPTLLQTIFFHLIECEKDKPQS